ncbi:pyridoxal phosphate-dependent transferase [Pterulicium gracile]|uniref:alanine--glyoxylate transaminase n=1 Tax=Pterulicium gracile TaxID=1884261 RepID=A0A5C3QIQ3_9AGAR|nr:pyridoxal phosphate-dependent transferase [Pterula gracilis]
MQRKTLAIPGPVELSDKVTAALAEPPLSHMSPEFVTLFGDCIRMTRELVFSTSAQVFIISGSGTLGWDQVSVNLAEPGDSALVLNSGYFGSSFKDCLNAYGAQVDEIKSTLGSPVDFNVLEKALRAKKYKIVTFTHVDTSTGVLSDARRIGDIVRRHSPDSILVLDGVCSVASEEIRMDDWGIDVIMTASQKGLGCPPGLSILCASERAIKCFKARKQPVASYYASWTKWLPIMSSYEAGSAAYFGTPSVNLVRAYHASLVQILRDEPRLQARFDLHKTVAQRVHDAGVSLGLTPVPASRNVSANGMSAFYLPEGIAGAEVLKRLGQAGVVAAGGLHVDIKAKYFRLGHMGASVVEPEREEIDKLVDALKFTFQRQDEGKATARL